MSQRNIMGSGQATAIGTTPTTFNETARGVYLGTSGDLTFTMEDGSSVQFVGMAAGIMHPIRFTAITAITTATGVVVLF